MAQVNSDPPLRVPASITFDAESLYVDGVHISLMLIPQMLYELTHPDSRKWYRFERRGDEIIVHVRISEEKPDGNPIANTAGLSHEDPGRPRQKTSYAPDDPAENG